LLTAAFVLTMQTQSLHAHFTIVTSTAAMAQSFDQHESVEEH
jgi:hypothetical protein